MTKDQMRQQIMKGTKKPRSIEWRFSKLIDIDRDTWQQNSSVPESY